MEKYTKSQLEQLIFLQLDSIETMQEQLHLIKEQNKLLEAENKKLKASAQPVKPYRNVKRVRSLRK